MPATILVCPHCEKTVEIQVSAVTRSRPCPECGEMVMLQMAEKSTRTKRRALLMEQAVAPEPEEPPPPKTGHDPQPLPGDAFERMRMDPEIKKFRKKLVLGAGIVGALILVLVAVSWFQSFREEKAKRELFGTEGAKNETSATAPASTPTPPTQMVVPEDLPPPVTSGNLVFRPAGGNMTTAAQTPAIPTENLARLAAGEDVVRQFLAAPNWRQRALTVRDQLRVAPLMSIYYGKNSDEPVSFDSLVEPTEVAPRFSEHVVVFEGGGRRTATVEHTPNGARVDWESFVGAGEMAWSDFLKAKPTTPTLFRVLVSPAGHYENSFGDPQTMKCYSLRSITEPGAKVVYGYMDKQNPQVKELDYWLERSNESVPMILRLRFPPEAPVDFQVWIQQVAQAGWVIK